jgi:hypothetical protein
MSRLTERSALEVFMATNDPKDHWKTQGGWQKNALDESCKGNVVAFEYM